MGYIIDLTFEIPFFQIFKDIFEVDIEHIDVDMKDGYAEASFLIDIHSLRHKGVKELLGGLSKKLAPSRFITGL